MVYVQTDDKAISSSTQKALKSTFESLERDFSLSVPTSFTSLFNTLAIDEEMEITDTVKTVLKKCKGYYQFTDGKFNPAIKKLVKLWQFDNSSINSQTFVPPAQNDIDNILNGKTDFSMLVLDESTNKVIKKADIEVDFGGIVKGYASEKALEILKKAGHKKGYVSVGSSSIAILSADSLGIRHPRNTNSLCLTVNTKNLKDVHVSTSGDYEKYHIYENKRYSHIIDPDTGKPADTGIASTTVICSDGGFSDAVTTALCTLSHTPSDNCSPVIDLMNDIAKQYTDAHIYVIYIKDGTKQLLTNKMQGVDFTLHDTEIEIISISN